MNFRHPWNSSYSIQRLCPARGTEGWREAGREPGVEGRPRPGRPHPACSHPVTLPAPCAKSLSNHQREQETQIRPLSPITQHFSVPSPLPGFLGPKQAAGCAGAMAVCAWPEARKLGGLAEQTALREGWNRHKNDQSPSRLAAV